MRTLLGVFVLSLFSLTLFAQLNIGDQAVSFKLKNVDNKMVSLMDYKKEKGLILIFTCNHCPYSIAYEDRIIAIDKQFKSKGFPVVAINPNDPELQPEDSFENMILRANEKQFTFPYLFDEKQEIYKAYGATRTPHVFLLKNQNKGKFTVEYIGAIDNNSKDAALVTEKYLENAINALLNNTEIEVKTTKAIGCSIKSKS